MSPTDIVGSKQKPYTEVTDETTVSTRGFGQNGYQGPSSLTPGQARKVSKQLSELTAPESTLDAIATRGVNNATAAAAVASPNYNSVEDNARLAEINHSNSLRATPTMRNRSHEGGAVPNSVTYGTPARPVKGNARTNAGPIKAFKA